MKKLIVFASLLLLAGFAKADMNKFKVPMDVNGYSDNSLMSAGVDNVYLVTSTNPVLVTDNSSTTIVSGFLHWVVLPSTANTAAWYLVLRDTGTANITSARLLPKLSPVCTSGTTLLTVPQIITFIPPVPFQLGLCANIEPVGTTAPNDGQSWGLGVRWKRQ